MNEQETRKHTTSRSLVRRGWGSAQSRNGNGHEDGHGDERDHKGKGSRPYDEFPLGPRYDGAQDFGQRASECRDTQRSFPSDPPVSFDLLRIKFSLPFCVRNCMVVEWARRGSRRGTVGSSILIHLSNGGDALITIHCLWSVSVCTPVHISTTVSPRWFTRAPAQDVHYDLRCSCAFPLRSPDEQFRGLHEPRPQYTLPSTRFGQTGFVTKGRRRRCVARAISRSPLESRGQGRGRRGLEGRQSVKVKIS